MSALHRTLLLLIALLAARLGWAAGTLPEDSGQPTRIEVYPATVKLTSQRSRVQLVVTGHYAGGEVRDLTRDAVYRPADPSIARLAGAVVSGQRDGQTTLEVEAGGRKASVPVHVSATQSPDPIRFEAEVLAVLTKQGCNAGSCHGAPEGKGGFALSMAAYKPSIDRESLILGGLSRRVQVIEPGESLLLKKPMLRVTHVGGKKLRKTDAAYPILYDWIYQGATPDAAGAARPTKIVVHPAAGRILHFPHVQQQLNVLAHFSDGSLRDVTAIATFDSTNKAVATVDAAGLVTGLDRGQTVITVRYLEHVESVYFTVVRDVPDFVWSAPPELNYVDRLVNQKLRQLEYLPAATCNDGVFLRRVYLDLTGLLPTADDAKAFLADNAPDKRAKKIDALLASPEFAYFWGSQTADLLRVNDKTLSADRAGLFSQWIVDSYQRNLPFDQFAKAILTASGDTRAVAPANYFEAVPKTQDLTETTAQIFMGSRINCAKCHNHPFENWTQNDYYRIGAVFSRVKVDGDMITLDDKGEMRNPSSGEVMQPWGADAAHGKIPADRRELFVHWLTERGNPFFARVEVNRIWSHLLGRGIVHPVDDFRSSNPPSNVALLDELAKDFEKHGYDRQHIIRTVAGSQTYQRSTETNRFNESDGALFSHYLVRRLSAEQLNDAIGYATGALAAIDTVPSALARYQSELDERLAQLPGELPGWQDARAKEMVQLPCWTGGWHTVGLFPAKNSKEAHQTVFPPEQGVDLAARYDQLTWEPRPNWRDAVRIDLPPGIGSHYLSRVIYSRKPAVAQCKFRKTAAVKVWLNGKLLLDHAAREQLEDRFELPLVAGENRLLIKSSERAANLSGQITFEIPTWDGQPLAKPEVPHHVVEAIAHAGPSQTDAERQNIADYHRDFDAKVRECRGRIERYTWRMDYATQRPYPEQSDFLRAFGQPKRETACACERSNEPTVDQALQLLNGERVARLLEMAVKKNATKPAEQFIDQLYLAALARHPSAKEREVAAAYLAKGADRGEAVRDLVWALVNTQEFLFQH